MTPDTELESSKKYQMALALLEKALLQTVTTEVVADVMRTCLKAAYSAGVMDTADKVRTMVEKLDSFPMGKSTELSTDKVL